MVTVLLFVESGRIYRIAMKIVLFVWKDPFLPFMERRESLLDRAVVNKSAASFSPRVNHKGNERFGQRHDVRMCAKLCLLYPPLEENRGERP